METVPEFSDFVFEMPRLTYRKQEAKFVATVTVS